ncbi:membrane protein FxsA [candidate division KSB3 bacterium]|uniref:Membrane protein FxsA n=1 Tax=candidate division KSB3 bacterium TaxID=2044937 RepID=A0A2G6E9S7_9BACT|nr:MAG: membrane protein FxsA [candidate division KSB3 bacterium]PIE29550.1 MAG: membrane protein FxsA [candidate division KSB3 bacterium]
MAVKLFLAFTLIPALEIYLLIYLGAAIGAWNTLLVILLTGVVGAFLARLEGWHTFLKIQQNLQQGRMPAEEMIDALIILVAGIMLLTPGFLTDSAGLLLLIPRVRFFFKRWLRKKFDRWNTTEHIDFRFMR